MNDPKSFASLGPTLLARKGAAKPAMRPQSTRISGLSGQATAQNLEDLGWDDMGENHPVADHSAEVLQLTPAPHNPESEALTDRASPRPKVRTMREELEARLAEEQAGRPAAHSPSQLPAGRSASTPTLMKVPQAGTEPMVSISPARPEPARSPPVAANDINRRAAFTLRLDAKRHLKLRLASTVRNRSAQQLVTEALDRFLSDIPEIESMAAQLRCD